jgi:hypothetical protein
MTRPAPPSGDPPPRAAGLADGNTVDLVPIASAVCARYAAEFPDERERYGAAGQEWCVHDNLYLLAWAIADAEGRGVDLEEQVDWLARVLEARDFPLPRLARDLALAAEELELRHPVLTRAAECLQHAGQRLLDGRRSP